MNANLRSLLFCLAVHIGGMPSALPAQEWPRLPERNGAVMIPAQEWPMQPGPREVRVGVYYPGGTRDSVKPTTGLILTLHNWGGFDLDGTANPEVLAKEFDVVALSVRYLQSGKKASLDDPEPYDFGYLQALDALRALWLAFHDLDEGKTPFARGRIFTTGGSGGGNVSLMANKLAPRTFTCVVDMCGMKKLSDALAYNLPAAGGLNARWSRDPASRNFLSPDMQEIRFVGHPAHLAEMKRLGTSAKIVTVHGIDDKTCLADAKEMVANMQRAKLDVVPVWVTKEMVDGKIFHSTGHSLGNRTLIPGHVAGKWLRPGGPDSLDRKTATDFERKDDIRYSSPGGAFVISYARGYPVARFEPAPAAPTYTDHADLMHVKDDAGASVPIKTPADWQRRRGHILAAMQRVMGPMPNAAQREALAPTVVEETKLDGGLVRRKVSYQTDAMGRVTAYLFVPETSRKKRPAVLCLQQTTSRGAAEPAGLAGDASMHVALQLARRGFVTIAPDYPGFGESKHDFSPRHGYASGTMKAIWDNIRTIDFLETLPEVDAAKIGVIGHSLGGHNAMFTAAFEPRLKAIVSNCGFTSFRKDDMPSWTGPRYMPHIKTDFGNDAAKVPFDFTEVAASFAPRPFLSLAAEGDTDFDIGGVRDVINAATPVYRLLGVDDAIRLHSYEGPHAFPAKAREVAYEWLERKLK